MIQALKNRTCVLWRTLLITCCVVFSVTASAEEKMFKPPAGSSAGISFHFVASSPQLIGKDEECNGGSKKLRYINVTGSSGLHSGGGYMCVDEKPVLSETRLYSARAGEGGDASLTLSLWGDKKQLSDVVKKLKGNQVAVVYKPGSFFLKPRIIGVLDFSSGHDVGLQSSTQVDFYLSKMPQSFYENYSLSSDGETVCLTCNEVPYTKRVKFKSNDDDFKDFCIPAEKIEDVMVELNYPICIEQNPILTDPVSLARPGSDSFGEPAVMLTIDDEQAEIFQELTSKYVWKKMAIVLSKKDLIKGRVVEEYVISNAVIGEAVGKHVEISGMFSVNEAKEIARQINLGVKKLHEMTITGFEANGNGQVQTQALARYMNRNISPLRTWFEEKWRSLQVWR